MTKNNMNSVMAGLYDQANDFNLEDSLEMLPLYSSLKDGFYLSDEETFIGEGALKRVTKCLDRHLSREVAVARPQPKLDISYYEMFVNEAKLTAKLNHPNIIKIYSIGIDEGGVPFFTMDLKSGRTLTEMVDSDAQRVSLLDTLIKVFDAISYAHSKGVIHLDLKPDNIQYDKYGEVLVCDWGLAKEKDLETEGLIGSEQFISEGKKTLFGEVRGTPGYMSPEQIHGESPKDERSDVYALGCLLHYLVSRQAPYTGKTKQILDATLESDASKISSHLKKQKVDKRLVKIILKALSKSPQDRYKSVADMKKDVVNYYTLYKTSVDSYPILFQLLLRMRRNKNIVSIVVSSVLLLSLIAWYYSNIIELNEFELAYKEGSLKNVQSEKDRIQGVQNGLLDVISAYGRIKHGDAASVVKRLSLGMDEDLSPVESIYLAQYMLEKAFRISKDKDEYAYYSNLINFRTLNLSAIEERAGLKNVSDNIFMLNIAKQFDDFAFNDMERPTVRQVEEVVKYADQHHVRKNIHLFAMLKYDISLRSHLEDYQDVLCAALQYYDSKVVSEFDSQSKSLSLSFPGPVKVRYSRGVESLLGYFVLNNLLIDARYKFDLYDLNGSSISILDLSDSEQLEISEDTFVNGLAKVILPLKMKDDLSFLDKLKSSIDYEVAYD